VEGISRGCSSAEKPVVKQEGFDEAEVAREEELMIEDKILGELGCQEQKKLKAETQGRCMFQGKEIKKAK